MERVSREEKEKKKGVGNLYLRGPRLDVLWDLCKTNCKTTPYDRVERPDT